MERFVMLAIDWRVVNDGQIELSSSKIEKQKFIIISE